ncbi:hypothetical protein SAMN05444171_1354 [Bradyrhizobium lablabi]|jgi:hypothetical protein|uniref:Uncharacterized protein n=2 Tax=Bradyrhizobium TaxID=374 RepID=A0ABY0Q644_9BRAD|nr:hypothetical protein SAMN05444163_5801 [Bradyrhizobium ottawaense]SEC41690.1 hypothetical protein SAMN05444171_1354 [Bradyrhizobium lablabi]
MRSTAVCRGSLRYSEMGSASIRPTPPASSPRILCSGRAQGRRVRGRRVRGPAGSFFDKRCGRPPRSQSRALVRGPDRDVSENPCAHDRRKAGILHLERDRLRAGPLRWATWIRFDPSSSPSATRPSVQASAATNKPKIPEQKWDFRGSWLYWRLPIFGTIGLENAFFSKASYFVGLVRFRKAKRQRHNLKSKSASVRVSVGWARVTESLD